MSHCGAEAEVQAQQVRAAKIATDLCAVRSAATIDEVTRSRRSNHAVRIMGSESLNAGEIMDSDTMVGGDHGLCPMATENMDSDPMVGDHAL